jgi:hypothetical protein
MSDINKFNIIQEFKTRLDQASDFKDVWEIVKDSVKNASGLYRVGMMLFLDDLPLHLGAYHPVGTNNIILNRTLLEIVQKVKDKDANAFTYTLLLHEYIHALGYIRESVVRSLVFEISKESFGPDHVVTRLASSGPWSILKKLPLYEIQGPKRDLEVVKNFDITSQDYIV